MTVNIEEALQKLSSQFATPIEALMDEYKQKLEHEKKIHPSLSEENHTQCAYQAVFARLQRSTNSEIKLYTGYFFVADTRINDFAEKEYAEVSRLAEGMSLSTAMEKGLKNRRGQLIYSASHPYYPREVINPKNVYFKIQGSYIDEDDWHPFLLTVYNLALFDDVILNKPVQFLAVGGSRSRDGLSSALHSTDGTGFQYIAPVNNNPDLPMEVALKRLPLLTDASAMLALGVEKTYVETINGNEVVKTKMVYSSDRYLMKDMLVTNVLKQNNGLMHVELAHESLLGWKIIAVFRRYASEDELVRDYRAHIYGRVITIVSAEKKLVLEATGAWQEAKYRIDSKEELDPSKIEMKFKL